MARAAAFRQPDLTRALRGAVRAGMKVRRAEIDPASGRIVIVFDAADHTEVAAPLDQWLATHARTS